MLFSSITFLYYFLPVVLVLYFAAPAKLKNLVLLLSSLFFYGWGEPKYVFLMAGMILAGFGFGLGIERCGQNLRRKKVCLVASLALNLGVLGYFKYADFFVENVNAVTGLSLPLLRIALPIGISFYTFQIISYLVDVYRGAVPAQKNILHLGTYIAMFPQLIAGPIVRYKDIARQLEMRTHNMDKAALGIRRFVLGLSKKVLLANQLGELCAIFRESADKSVLFYWMYAAAFMLQIYFDFSGYSDMAIGLGKILGFDLLENFNYPYISKSITEFWRRWHMSLGSWFRDYVYIPLGGSRVKKSRWFFNIFVVWFLTGFWHGAAWNFIVWGLLYAAFLMIEKACLLKVLERSKIVSHVYVLFIVMIGFVIFNAPSMEIALQDVAGLFGLGMEENIPLYGAEAIYYLRSYGVVFVAAVFGATPLPKLLGRKLEEAEWKGQKVLSWLEIPLLLVLLIFVTAYLVDGSFNPFLYFRF